MKHLISILLFLFVMSSCENFLDLKPTDGTYEDEFVWSNPSFARGVLFSAYSSFPIRPNTMGEGEFIEISTDDAVTNNLNSGNRIFSMGGLSPTSNAIDCWNREYELIRNINLWLENGLTLRYHSDPNVNIELIERYTGEALAMRAYIHWKLLKHYGGTVNGQPMGVPVMIHALPVNDWNTIQRPTYQETVRQIFEDCDAAYDLLPPTYSGTGIIDGARHGGGATQKSVKALKAIVALFAASPANNPSNNNERWKESVDLAIEAILEIDGQLNATPLPARNFFQPENPDVIWRGRYITDYFLEINNLPPTLYGEGRNNPSQNLVEAFPMANGYPITDVRSSYNPENPYAGRDPRFYENILYNGSTFNGVVVDTYIGGKDHRSANLIGTRTGYFLLKFLSPNVELHPVRRNSRHSFYTVLSKTEIYFALAEALNEYLSDPNDASYGISAKEALSKIRKRAGYHNDPFLDEQANAGKNAFRDMLKNERRIELCFEDRRFWDLRRWGDPVNNAPVYGIKISSEGAEPTYEKELLETRRFESPFLPLPYHEVMLLNNVPQNDGW